MNKCPVNSLYIILRLHDQPASYREVEERLPVGPNGSSLAQVRDCASSFGLHAQVVQGSPEGLSHCPLPALAHCDEQQHTGHYVVVLAVRDDEVEVIDGTTVIRQTLPMSDFTQRWSGHLIVFERPTPRWRSWILLPVALGFVGLGLFVWGRRRTRRASLPAPQDPSASHSRTPFDGQLS